MFHVSSGFLTILRLTQKLVCLSYLKTSEYFFFNILYWTISMFLFYASIFFIFGVFSEHFRSIFGAFFS